MRNGDVMVMSYMNNIQIFDGRTHTCETLEVDEDDWLSCISRSRFTPTDAMEDGYGYINGGRLRLYMDRNGGQRPAPL